MKFVFRLLVWSFFAQMSLSGSVKAADALTTKTPKKIPENLAHDLIEKYSVLAFKEYSDSLSTAQNLEKTLETLTQEPTAASLAAAKKAWFKARDAYTPTEAFRFYGGPIDDPKTGPETLINSWPIDEAYIDYVQGNPSAGIINHEKEYPQITKEVLISLNQKNGERNVSTGYHAIEFLLWGQHLSQKTNEGSRPVSDFDSNISKSASRRGTYLVLLGQLLVEHLSKVRDAWDSSHGKSYKDTLLEGPLDESLRKIYTGLTNLSIDEMSGERMTVSLEKNDPENQQDCFSDYTLTDLRSNQSGIRRIYFEGGVQDLSNAIDAKLTRAIDAALLSTQVALKKMPNSFHQVIASPKSSSGRKSAEKAITSLQSQGKLLAQSGKMMGLILNVQ